MKVLVDVDNKRMGTNNSLIIWNAMAKAGTSNTLAIQIQVPKDAPNLDVQRPSTVNFI